MSIAAMKQALEALETATHQWEKEDAITSLRQAIEQAEKQVVFKIYKPTLPRGAIPNVRDAELPWVYDQDPWSGNVASLWVTPVKAAPQPQRERVIFPTMLRKMWSGGEVQAWLDENVNKEKNT